MGSIAVIGTGASGISCAFFLAKKGHAVTMFERDSIIGGRMSTLQLNGKSVCLGGKNIGLTYKNFRKLCQVFGEDDFEEFGLNSSNSANGEVKTFDPKMKLRKLLGFFKGLPFKDLIRLLRMILAIKISRSNAYLSGWYFRRFNFKESGKINVSDYFGQEVQSRLLRPLLVRNNGAEPAEICLETLGTNLSMILDNYEQLRKGPDELFKKVKEKYEVRLNTEISNIDNVTKNGCTLRLQNGDVQQFDGAIIATTANVASRLTKKIDEKLSDQLRKIRYYPVAVVVAEYDMPIFNKHQRAFTFPVSCFLSNAGAYGKNDLSIVRYTFSGEKARNLISGNPSSDKLLQIAEQELQHLSPFKLGKCLGKVSVNFSTGLCAYAPKYFSILSNLKNQIAGHERIEIAGDYIEGVSIEGCFISGKKAAYALHNKIRKQYDTENTGLFN